MKSLANKTITTQIVPSAVQFYGTGNEIDYKAICLYVATCFFFDQDTYYKGLKVMRPATSYQFDEAGKLQEEKPYFNWHYAPREISLDQAVEEFSHIFENVSEKLTKGKKVILPLSGGLDSRSQAAVLKGREDVFCYSYQYENSFEETKYGKQIAQALGFDFKAYTINKGYLWERIEQLADLNKCYAEFTHPRSMSIYEEYAQMEGTFFLGHMGDLLFDDMGVPDKMSFEEQLETVLKKIIQRGGLEIANALWTAWGLEGTFEDYLKERVAGLLSSIKIDNANARIRAFKSMFYVPRWSSVNYVVFSSQHPIAIPYYANEFCEFICTLPEKHLAARQIQIEYIKRKAPELAKIPWQPYDPFNLYNYKEFLKPKNIPGRAVRKAKRMFKEQILGQKMVTRNWEIQFRGEENDKQLKAWLFNNSSFKQFVPTELVMDFYNKFKTVNELQYAHPMSMLLTLSLFSKKYLP